MNELQIIQAIRRWTSGSAPGLVTGIGDDCAVVRPRANRDLLFTTDFLIDGIHFLRDRQSAVECGHRALTRGLSDIAAMGGTPRYALFSLALADWTEDRWVRDFYKGVGRLAAEHGVAIIGGDLTRAREFGCDVVVIGDVPRGKALLRSGAGPGDVLYVSGMLGAAAASNWTRTPHARVDLGLRLPRAGATACMDITDGLALDLHRICVESKVMAHLDEELPVDPAATLEQALYGGEDYELLVALPKDRKPPRSLGLHRIGVVVAPPSPKQTGKILFRGKALPRKGWDPVDRP